MLHNRYLQRLLISIAFILSLSLFLTACGGGVPSEKQVMEDINHVNPDELCGYILDSVSFTDTQKDKEDFSAAFHFSGKDEYSECKGTGRVKYRKAGKEGWQIDGMVISSFESKLVSAPSPEELFPEFDDVLSRSGLGQGAVNSDYLVVNKSVSSDTRCEADVQWKSTLSGISAICIAPVRYMYYEGEWMLLLDSWTDTLDTTCYDIDYSGLVGRKISGQTNSGARYEGFIEELDATKMVLGINGDRYEFKAAEGDDLPQAVFEKIQDNLYLSYYAEGKQLEVQFSIGTGDMSSANLRLNEQAIELSGYGSLGMDIIQ